MATIPGFTFDYDCISDGEALERNHEYGDNFVDIKDIKELGSYRKLLGSYATVFRSNVIKRIEIEKVTIGDFVILVKGDIVPADAVVIESQGLVLMSLTDNKLIEGDLNNKDVYQGMKVLAGTATIMVAKIGPDTFLGKKLKDIISYNHKREYKNKLVKVSIVYSIICVVAFVVTAIVSLIRFWSVGEQYKAITYPMYLLMAMLPVELVLMNKLNIIKMTSRLKNGGVDVKTPFTLVDLDKVKILCVYDDFFSSKNVNDMQRIYRSGIRVIMLSTKNPDYSRQIALDSGISSDKSLRVVTGEELKAMNSAEIRKTVLEVMVFAEMDSEANELVTKALKDMGVPILSMGRNINDVVSEKISDMGILVDGRKETVEYAMANAMTKDKDMKTILEMLRVARKFSDSLKKSILYVMTTRIPLILLTIFAIIMDDKRFLYFWLIPVVYWIWNLLVTSFVGTANGDELILNVDAKKNVFTVQDVVLLILKIFVFSLIIALVYLLVTYLELQDFVMRYIMIGTIAFVCLVMSYFGRNKVKEKVIRKRVKAKIRPEKPKKVKPEKVAKVEPEEPEKPWDSGEKKEDDAPKAKGKMNKKAEELQSKKL